MEIDYKVSVSAMLNQLGNKYAKDNTLNPTEIFKIMQMLEMCIDTYPITKDQMYANLYRILTC